MTRKHFEALADIAGKHIEWPLYRDDKGKTMQCSGLVEELADFCASMNPRFNREQFITACYKDQEASA